MIPFNRPSIVGKEQEYIADVLQKKQLSGDGHYTKLCNQLLEEKFGFKHTLLTTSCTHAMELAALLYEIKEGDEVILPSYTFVSTANAFVLRGAIPVFIDIEPNTLNLDITQLEKLITPKTRLIVPVHYGGLSCDMDQLMTIAQKYHIEVFEDAAQAIDAQWNGRYLGTFGSMAALSFHETKNIVSGEGGALLINDERFKERAEIIREKGTNRSQFLRGVVDKYTWIDVGSSYLPSELIAAYLYAQLEEIDKIQAKRRNIFTYYSENLRSLQTQGYLQLSIIPPKSSPNYHLFFILLENAKTSDNLMKFLRKEDIHAVFHYQPLHLSEMGRKYETQQGNLPITEEYAHRLLRLPLFYELTTNQQDHIINAIYQFFGINK